MYTLLVSIVLTQICKQEIYGEENFNLKPLSFSKSFRDRNWIELLSERGEVVLNAVNLDYSAASKLEQSKLNYWALSLEIKMTRKMMQSFIKIIAPPGLLFIVSWVSQYLLWH